MPYQHTQLLNDNFHKISFNSAKWQIESRLVLTKREKPSRSSPQRGGHHLCRLLSRPLCDGRTPRGGFRLAGGSLPAVAVKENFLSSIEWTQSKTYEIENIHAIP